MKRNIVEIKKHFAKADDAHRRNSGVATIEVTTLVFECGHTRIYRGTSGPIPRNHSSCKECNRRGMLGPL